MTLPNQTPEHLYLFTLEVTPLEVGQVYDELPLHCTFMFRFWSESSPEGLAERVKTVFDAAPPLVLLPYEHAQLGPRKVGAYLVEKVPALMALHLQLQRTLTDVGVDFTEPQWVGQGYKPHITDRSDEAVMERRPLPSAAAYLIEVIDGKRYIRARFPLPG